MRRLLFSFFFLLSFLPIGNSEAENENVLLSENYFLQNPNFRKNFEGEQNVLVAQYCQKGGSNPLNESFPLKITVEKMVKKLSISTPPVGGNRCSEFFRLASASELDMRKVKKEIEVQIASANDSHSFLLPFLPAEYVGGIQITANIQKNENAFKIETSMMGYKDTIREVYFVLVPAYERKGEQRISKGFRGFSLSTYRGSINTKGLSGQYSLSIIACNTKGDILGTDERIFVL